MEMIAGLEPTPTFLCAPTIDNRANGNDSYRFFLVAKMVFCLHMSTDMNIFRLKNGACFVCQCLAAGTAAEFMQCKVLRNLTCVSVMQVPRAQQQGVPPSAMHSG